MQQFCVFFLKIFFQDFQVFNVSLEAFPPSLKGVWQLKKKHQFNLNYLFEYDFVITKITSDLFSSIATVTSAFAVEDLFSFKNQWHVSFIFTLKRSCLVALNYRRYKILPNTYFKGFK